MAILAINITGTMPVPRRLAMPQPTACHGHPGHQHHGHDARATSRRDAATNRVPWPSWPSTSRARCPCHVASRCPNQPRRMAILAINITGRMPVPCRVAMPQPTAWHGHPGHEHHGQDARATSRRGQRRWPWPNAVRPYKHLIAVRLHEMRENPRSENKNLRPRNAGGASRFRRMLVAHRLWF